MSSIKFIFILFGYCVGHLHFSLKGKCPLRFTSTGTICFVNVGACLMANVSTDVQETIEVVILFNRSSGIETSRLSPLEAFGA